MRSVVQVSAAEVVRMVASLVLQRPENLGKCVVGIEQHHDPQGIVGVHVVMYDTLAEAEEYRAGMAAAAKAAGPTLVVVPKPEAPAVPSAP